MAGSAPFPQWLKQRRKALDLTQEELAERVGCAVTTIRKFEGGVLRPSRQVVERLADQLELVAEDREAFIRAARGLSPPDRAALLHPADLPTGTVTFLFTDIEGSTRLWEQYPQVMQANMARHDSILRFAIAAHEGAIFKTVGDGLCAAFATASDALVAALAAQRALQLEAWGQTGPLLVRMALHTGIARAQDGDYAGLPLSRIARLLSAAHGGQILLSRATEELVCDNLPPGVLLRNLGEHRLKDLSRPELIFQLVAPDLPADFPPLRTLSTAPSAGAEPSQARQPVSALSTTAHGMEVAAPAAPPETPIPACPYPGMVPFHEADHARFFGRTQEVHELLERLRVCSLQMVIGPSGSGKSSLVFAGLLPALRRSSLFSPGGWLVRSLRPGATPMAALATTLGVSPADLATGVLPGQCVADLLAATPDASQLLVVVDQFEELFTLGRAEAEPFQQALLQLIDIPNCAVILTVRADFYPDLMVSPLWRTIKAHRLEVAPLDPVQLRQAIRYPARDVGVQVDAALVERLVADAAGEPGVLPLVQETLVLLWERLGRQPVGAREPLTLQLAAYESLGSAGRTGLQVAMARRADAALAALTPAQYAIARRMVLRLIQFGEGQADTRRQLPIAALRSAGDDPAMFDQTLHHLVDRRLLVLSGEAGDSSGKVDLAHEALIAGWPTLQQWLAERRDVEQARRRLEIKVAEWTRLGRGQGGLLDAVALREAERWLADAEAAELGYDADLLALIQASRSAILEAEQERAAHAAAEAAQQRLAFLAEASSILASSLDYRATLTEVARLIVPYLADWCAIDLVEPQQALRRLAAAHVDPTRTAHIYELHRRYPPNPNALRGRAQVLRSGQPERIAEIPAALLEIIARDAQHLRLLREVGYHSVMIVPMIARDHPIGVLSLVRTAASACYGASDLALGEDLAHRVALAVENARLFAEHERRLHEVSAIKDLGSAITSTLELPDVLERLHAELRRVIDVSTSFLGLYDAAQNRLSFPVCYDHGERVFQEPITLDGGINHWAIAHRQALLLGTDAEANRYRQGVVGVRVGPEEQNEESYLVVPISAGDEMLGVINIQSYKQHAFTENDLRFVSTVANHAAIAIGNARLFQERGRQIAELATLNEIGQALSAVLPLDDLVDLIYRQTSRLLDTTSFYMALSDERRNEVTFPLFYERGQRIVVEPLQAPGSLTHYVIQTRAPLLVQGPDYAEQIHARGIQPVGEWSKSWLGVPMIAADRVLGVIGIQDYEHDHAYSQEDVRLLTTIASWAAIALENARLLQNEQIHRQAARTLRDVALILTNVLALDAIMDLILDHLVAVIPCAGAAFMLREEGRFTVGALRGTMALAPLDTAPLLEEIVRTRAPLVRDDSYGSPFFTAGAEAIRSWIGAPLLLDDTVIGLLAIAHTIPQAYDDEDAQLAFALASQAAQAIRVAQLVEMLPRTRAVAR